MGKTPGKWIKALFGKKSSKADVKGRYILKSANRESLIATKVPVSETPVASPLISPLILEIGSRNGVDSGHAVPAELPNEVVNFSSANEDGSTHTTINLGSEIVPERIRHNQAAIKAQAAFRGYQARRAFQSLKGIIRLQALMRGYLVRRQAVFTLLCIQRIVKFQALARGQKVRRSDIGIEVRKIRSSGNVLGASCSNSSGVSTSTVAGKLSNNGFAKKLLASSPPATPLRLSCDPGEPNSIWQWLERWTKLRFGKPHSPSKKNMHTKSQVKCGSSQTVETERGILKRNFRKSSSSHTESGSVRSSSESDKPKHNPRKVSSNPVDSVHEPPQNDIEMVKCNLRKNSNSTKEVSERLEIDNEKPKHCLKKPSSSAAPDVWVLGTSDTDKVMDMALTVSNHSVVNTTLKLPEDSDPIDELLDHPAAELQSTESSGKLENVQGTNEELNSKDHHISNENHKTSWRRASFLVKIDDQENGLQSTPKVPGYMAPTESAKAKLRGQGSPRFSQEVVEKNCIPRRHSLPSSNGKLSSLSPRVTRLVQAAGKGVVRTDQSLTSSRDGDKLIQAEWRR